MKEGIIPIILGPTASGKTQLAVALAHEVGGEIVSIDSRQLYKKMDIGTGKDLEEYRVGNRNIPHHLIDIAEPGEAWNINDFYQAFSRAMDDIRQRKSIPILCGGSGLYLETVLFGNELSAIPTNLQTREVRRAMTREALRNEYEALDEKIKRKTDSSTVKRMIRALEIGDYLKENPWPKSRRLEGELLVFGLNPPVEVRRDRISKRLLFRLENGLVEEVEALLKSGISPQKLEYYGLEYKWVTAYVMGQMAFEHMASKLETEIRRFAKRQMTWFRRMERKGLRIIWLDTPDLGLVMKHLG